MPSIDKEGRIIFSNKSITLQLGYEFLGIEGSSSFSQMHPDDREKIRKLYKKVFEQKRDWKNAIIRWLQKAKISSTTKSCDMSDIFHAIIDFSDLY